MTWLATAVVATTLFSGAQQASALKKSAKSEEAQLAINADRRLVEGRMDAAEIRRQKRILLGDARAAMAASGGTTTSPQAIFQLGEIAGASKFNELSALYESRMDAEAMRRGGAAVLRSGRSAARAAYAGSIVTVLGSAAGQSLLSSGYTSFKNWTTRSVASSASVVQSTPAWSRGP